MAMSRPSEMGTAPASKPKKSADSKSFGDQRGDADEPPMKYPTRNNNAADRIKSGDWISEYKNDSEPSLLGAFPKDVFGCGVDSVPLPLETNDFVPDSLFDSLKASAERQGKGTDALDKLAKSMSDQHQVASGRNKTSAADEGVASEPFGAMFDTEAGDECLDVLLPALPKESSEAQEGPHPSPALEEAAAEIKASCIGREMTHGRSEEEIMPPLDADAAAAAAAPASHDVMAAHTNNDGLMSSSTTRPLESGTPLLSNSLPDSAAPSPLTLASSSKAVAYKPSKGFCEPQPNDVLLGRGGLTNHHSGNKRYRKHADELKAWYDSCGTKSEKKELSQLLVEYIHGYGGRFLKRDDNERWYEVAQNTARKKASQALREGRKPKNPG